jgi:hypothetical protein
MLQSIEGIYKDGKVELTEMPSGINTARVIVTFLSTTGSVDLPSRGINEEKAANLRARLQCFAQDWDQLEMEVYDAL